MSSRGWILLLLAWGVGAPASGQPERSDASREVQGAAERIEWVLPDGYVDACAARDDIRRLFAASQPPGAVLQTCLFHVSELSSWDDPSAVSSTAIFILTSLRRFEDRDMPASEFAAVASAFEEQQREILESSLEQVDDTLDRAAEEASVQAGAEIEIGKMAIVPRGAFLRKAQVFGFAFERSLPIRVEGEIVETRQAIAALLLHIRNRFLMVSVEKDLHGPTDLEAVKALAASFAALQGL